MKTSFSIALLAIALFLQSCGGATAVDKDAKPDFTMTPAELDHKGDSNPDQYTDKIIELTGKVQQNIDLSASGDTEYGSLMVFIEDTSENRGSVSVFFTSDPGGLSRDKVLTLKGKGFQFESKKGIGLKDCVVIK